MSNFDRETQEYLDYGLRLLLSYWFHHDEREHCRMQWELMGKPAKGVYADMGSGVGTFGLHISKLAPTLVVYNVTNSDFQHQYQERLFRSEDCTNVFSKHESFTSTSFADDSVDTITFNESFGYADLDATLAEVSRILKPGGALFIKECFVTDKKPPLLLELQTRWKYIWYRASEIISHGEGHGLRFEQCIRADAYADKFVKFWRSSRNMQRWFGPAAPLPPRHRVGIFHFRKP